MMTIKERRRATEGRVRAAEDAVARLKEGFSGVGITLPSLQIDPVSCAGNDPVTPLVDLGRCNLDTALRLSVVLEAQGLAGHER
ncbi:hypothetical protein OHU11_20025 [Streptomyces sp. NBC_00257]|uniref:hypothetical protein n=2 Tax=Streptomyces TaxID=1883 RepID=UPI00224F4263|nr:MULTISPECIES: hypothetical protein [unclassified Streptomyces]WSW10620.1 hypothetical protein OG298_18895 [Streptomyces sp. NBC_01005]WTB59780.1 hypothetical protein OG832_23345 [Streptomyces sp. NBC_00826]WTD00125.1 hypothetical protein OH736_18900 [Streptomyces sp. NBC_01650]WTH95630.1 hypothetical protein OIC43_20350 [Streptomyces sp. NBC_00825]WTI04360.1 hypothetical protein OHA23_20335 [Streptomyces sp. NBC_00822]